ncbi:MAG: rhodanese-like domain-containing protein [Anaerolineales bacterium]
MSNDTFSTWLSGLDFEFWSTGQHKIDPPVFFEKWAKGEAVLLDVRAEEEKQFAVFPFALAIPINELPARLNEIPRDKLVVTFCSGGDRANVAFAYLRTHGFENVRILKAAYPELMAELLPGKLRKTLQAKNG